MTGSQFQVFNCQSTTLWNITVQNAIFQLLQMVCYSLITSFPFMYLCYIVLNQYDPNCYLYESLFSNCT